MKIAIYPGSFDPITNGHIDILERACKAFDKVVLLIADNPSKTKNCDVHSRIWMAKEATKHLNNVIVDSTTELTVSYAKKIGATHLVRGLRAVTDFEYEFQLNAANHFIDNNIDSVYFMTNQNYSYISSSTVMQLYKNGVDIKPLVPEAVNTWLKQNIKKN